MVFGCITAADISPNRGQTHYSYIIEGRSRRMCRIPSRIQTNNMYGLKIIGKTLSVFKHHPCFLSIVRPIIVSRSNHQKLIRVVLKVIYFRRRVARDHLFEVFTQIDSPTA